VKVIVPPLERVCDEDGVIEVRVAFGGPPEIYEIVYVPVGLPVNT
jgi:hypothetical protein